MSDFRLEKMEFLSWQTYGTRKRLRFTFMVPWAPGGEHSAGMRIGENPLLVLTAGKDRNLVILSGVSFLTCS